MVNEHHKKREDYQIILLDWKLPGMNGIQVAKEIRSNLGDEVPILLISAYDWSEFEQEAREAGISGFISKPLFKSTLFHGLRQYMDMEIKIPFPCKLIEESNARKVKRALMNIIEEKKIDTVVFGLPLSDDGKESEWCFEIRRFADFLLKSVKVEIVFIDEYGTSKDAEYI